MRGKPITRAELEDLLRRGRKLVYATLQDRQDYMASLSPKLKRPLRDVTDEPHHHNRTFLKLPK